MASTVGFSRRRLASLAVLAAVGAASQGVRIASGDHGVFSIVEFVAFASMVVFLAWPLSKSLLTDDTGR